MKKTYKPNLVVMFFLLLFPVLVIEFITVLYLVVLKNQNSIQVFSENINIWLTLFSVLAFKTIAMVIVATILIVIEFSVEVGEEGIIYKKFLIKKTLIPWSEISEYKKTWLLVPLVSVKSNVTNKKCRIPIAVVSNSYFSALKKAA